MKGLKRTALFMCFIMLFSIVSFAEPADTSEEAEGGPNLTAVSYILINMDTGEVLLEHNAAGRRAPASTTKILTALLGIEALDREGTSTVSAQAVNSIPWDSSKLGLNAGESFNNYDLICAMLVSSGNDAANVVAEAVSGSVEAFVDRMNERAASLGCTDTHFVNTHGYSAEGHYTTAADLARIARAAMQNPVFREMAATKSCELPGKGTFYTTNRLMQQYDNVTGIKTGYTSEAGFCLVASAGQNGLNLLSVVFGVTESGNQFTDTKALFDWGFDNYQQVKAVAKDSILDEVKIKYAKDEKTIKLVAAEDFSIVLKKGSNLADITTEVTTDETVIAPVGPGDVLGTVKVFRRGELVGEVHLTADKVYRYSGWAAFFDFLGKIVGIGILIILAVMLVLVIIRQREYEKRRRARQRERSQRR